MLSKCLTGFLWMGSQMQIDARSKVRLCKLYCLITFQVTMGFCFTKISEFAAAESHFEDI